MPKQKPVVFIGSSSEGKLIADAIQYHLKDVCQAIIWDQGVFAPASSTLESLVSQMRKFDFAILVFTPDDPIESRGEAAHSPRDNVLVELGLFIGGLGRHRTFVVCENAAEVKIPSDLAGVNLLRFELPRGDGQLLDTDQRVLSTLGPACFDIKAAVRKQGVRVRTETTPALPPTPPESDHDSVERTAARRVVENRQILGYGSAAPSLDTWHTDICPVLHQTAHYTMPTYYLDCDLHILDWNLAFELAFTEIVGALRFRHVNDFIARLANCDEVFDHGREFTRRVHAGELPLVDLEPLIYRSYRYGDIRFLKVATQIHDPSGNLRGWSVGLLIQDTDWTLYERDLEKKIQEDKLWSVYAASYDRVLNLFPPYRQLIEDVIAVIPDNASAVVDLGAGTGNTTEALLGKGYRVTSVEFNSAMIDRMREKHFDSSRHTIIKASLDQLDSLRMLEGNSFDAASMVNVLYGVDDPLACLIGVRRILKPGGVLGLSTTHADVMLDPLLTKIKENLKQLGKQKELAADFQRVYEINKEIERTVARRVSAEKYKEWVRAAGFQILHSEDYTYEGAVMLIHARKQ